MADRDVFGAGVFFPDVDDVFLEFAGHRDGTAVAVLTHATGECDRVERKVVPDEVRPGEFAGLADAEATPVHEADGQADVVGDLREVGNEVGEVLVSDGRCEHFR